MEKKAITAITKLLHHSVMMLLGHNFILTIEHGITLLTMETAGVVVVVIYAVEVLAEVGLEIGVDKSFAFVEVKEEEKL